VAGREPFTTNESPLLAARSDHECFGCGDNNPIGLHLRFVVAEDEVRATFVPKPAHQGFEGVIHGGIISTVLDEAMAWATAAAGIWAVTAELSVRFRRPLYVGESTTVKARLGHRRSRTVTATADLVKDADQVLVATGTAKFVRVSEETAAAWRARYLNAPAREEVTEAVKNNG
jgi:uncharacterized protein (TIGR00369 family)